MSAQVVEVEVTAVALLFTTHSCKQIETQIKLQNKSVKMSSICRLIELLSKRFTS